jgi:SAM-dependent methyltransferase
MKRWNLLRRKRSDTGPDEQISSAPGDLRPGDRDYRAWVGPPGNYDLLSALQFSLLIELGLRESHYLLDIGCGSLRAGRLFIPYLLPGRYHGLEPEKWVLEAGIDAELGRDILRIKQPVFQHNSDFNLSVFNRKFDYLLAQSVFTHAAGWQIRRCLDEAARVLSSNGIFAATFLAGEHDHEGDSWVYPGVTYFTSEFMQQAAREAGLTMRYLEWHHPGVAKPKWAIFTRAETLEGLPPKLLREDVGALSKGNRCSV